MSKKRAKPVNRGATRRSTHLRAVTQDDARHAAASYAGAGEGGPAKVDLHIVFGEDVDPAAMVASIGREAVRAVSEARTALRAEIAVSELLGMIDQAGTEAVGDAAEVDALLGPLIDWAERDGTPGALALLRVLAVIGPSATRDQAASAAGRLTATGVKDSPWARIVGRPRTLRAWRYGDVFGRQESVGVLFDYTGREHAISVLIDHDLGGGVKDCWVAEGRNAREVHRRVTAEMAANPVAEFDDVAVVDALAVLQATLAQPVCPRQDDQIRDVGVNLELLRARVRLLAEESRPRSS